MKLMVAEEYDYVVVRNGKFHMQTKVVYLGETYRFIGEECTLAAM